MSKIKEFADLKGTTFASITTNEESISIELIDGRKFKLAHSQCCCEEVWLEEVIGDLSDLVGTDILLAEEVSNLSDSPPLGRRPESYTWTFYKLATIKGSVTFRFYGESNGYYSEEVTFYEVGSNE